MGVTNVSAQDEIRSSWGRWYRLQNRNSRPKRSVLVDWCHCAIVNSEMSSLNNGPPNLGWSSCPRFLCSEFRPPSTITCGDCCSALAVSIDSCWKKEVVVTSTVHVMVGDSKSRDIMSFCIVNFNLALQYPIYLDIVAIHFCVASTTFTAITAHQC